MPQLPHPKARRRDRVDEVEAAPDPAPSAWDRRARSLLESAWFGAVASEIEGSDEETLAEQVALTEIPAPPFGEAERGRHVAHRLREIGLDGVHRDEVGNVLASVGPRTGAPLVVSAHLDTVFPEQTDVTVRREGSRMTGPGISDDGRGLAVLLALARVFHRTGTRLRGGLLFVATVGEEGAGDLRGCRHLFREGGPGRGARGFISLDGAGMRRLVTGGLGSKRLRLWCSGPGGHSWSDYGSANPIHVLGDLVASLAAIDPGLGASISVTRWGGGTSVNALPERAWIDVEIRAVDQSVVDSVEERVRRLAHGSLARSNEALCDGCRPASLAIETIGNRPAGSTASDAPLVLAAVAATRALGCSPLLTRSSTDANVPMALGIPAIAMGAGGRAGAAHTTREWYDNVGGPAGILRAAATLALTDRPAGRSGGPTSI